MPGPAAPIHGDTGAALKHGKEQPTMTQHTSNPERRAICKLTKAYRDHVKAARKRTEVRLLAMGFVPAVAEAIVDGADLEALSVLNADLG